MDLALQILTAVCMHGMHLPHILVWLTKATEMNCVQIFNPHSQPDLGNLILFDHLQYGLSIMVGMQNHCHLPIFQKLDWNISRFHKKESSICLVACTFWVTCIDLTRNREVLNRVNVQKWILEPHHIRILQPKFNAILTNHQWVEMSPWATKELTVKTKL